MTTQEAYEAQRAWFSRPGARLGRDPAYPHDHFQLMPCRYRGRDDPSLRCAVGCLIPDSIYDPAWEGTSARCLLSPDELLDEEARDTRGALSLTRLSLHLEGVDLHWIAQTQRLHDYHAKDAEHLVQLLDEEAEKFGLVRSSP